MLNKLKGMSSTLKKTMDNMGVSEKAGSVLESVKKKTEQVAGQVMEMLTDTYEDEVIIANEKVTLFNHVLVKLNMTDFKVEEVDKEKFIIVAKYFKVAVMAGGKFDVRMAFVEVDEIHTKIKLEITINKDTNKGQLYNYCSCLNEIMKCLYMADAVGAPQCAIQNTTLEQEHEHFRNQYMNRLLEKASSISEESIFAKIGQENLLEYTQEFNEKLHMPATNWGNYRINFYPNLDQAEVAKNKKLPNLMNGEIPIVLYNNGGFEGFIITNQHIYFNMRECESKLYLNIAVPIQSIKTMEIESTSEGIHFIIINGERTFTFSQFTISGDVEVLEHYLNKISKLELAISDEEVSTIIKKKLGDKLVSRLNGIIEADENILYFAWGLDSITAKDYIVCTNRRIIIMNREVLGLGENIKSFEMVDIISVAVGKGESFLESALSTLFKQADLQLYVAGTQMKIETLLRVEAERVAKIINMYKKINKDQDRMIIQQVVEPTVAPAVDVVEQIKKLSELKELGILSEEEFNSKKQDLLSRL